MNGYQLPVYAGETIDLAGKRWRKQVLPKGIVKYGGGVLGFSDKVLERIASNFKNFVRPSDNTAFGDVVRHVCLTGDPHVAGMAEGEILMSGERPWDVVPGPET